MAGVIALVTGEYPPMIGGIADYTVGLATALANAGERVVVVSDRRADRAVSSPGWSIRRLPALRRTILATGATVAHIQYQTAAFGLGAGICLLPALLPIPTVVTFHDTRLPYLFPKAGPSRRQANVVLARTARAAVCTNGADQRDVQALGAWSVNVIPLGNNVPPVAADREATRSRLGLAGCVVGHFGLMGSGKGVEALVAALRDVPATLLLIGAATGDADATNLAAQDSVRRAIQAAGLADRVRWTGRGTPADLSAALAACDLLVLPYREGVSFRRTTLVASLAHGLPIVTTTPIDPLAFAPVDGLPDLRHGRDLWLVPAGEGDALAGAMATLLANPSLRRSLGNNAATAATAFDWATVAERHRALYASLP